MNNLKRIIAVFIGVLIAVSSVPAYAAINIDEIVPDDEIKLIEKNDYFTDDINSALDSDFSFNGRDMGQIDNDYIDYSKMVKKYYNFNIMEQDILTSDIMRECLKDKIYGYELPVNFDDTTLLLDIQIEKPLTEEEYELYDEETIAFYENRVGTWTTKCLTICDSVIDYRAAIEKLLKKNGVTDCDVYILADLTYSLKLVAVICTDNSDDTRFIALEQKYNADDMELDKETFYTLEEMKNFEKREGELLYEQIHSNDGLRSGGGLTDVSYQETGNTKIMIISAAGVVLIAAVVITVLAIRKKKKIKNIES